MKTVVSTILICFAFQIMSAQEGNFERTLSELKSRIGEAKLGDSTDGLAENFPIFKNWEDFGFLVTQLNSNPEFAAERAVRAEDPIDGFLLVCFAADGEGPSYLTFWERMMEGEDVQENLEVFVEHGLSIKGSRNADTLAFNFDNPRVANLLKKIGETFSSNQRIAGMIGLLESGEMKKVRTKHFKEYSSEDRRDDVPDLSSISDEIKDAQGQSKGPDSPRENGDSVADDLREDGKSGYRIWLLIAVLGFGLLIGAYFFLTRDKGA